MTEEEADDLKRLAEAAQRTPGLTREDFEKHKQEQIEKELMEKIDDALEQTSKYLYVLDGKKVVPCKRASDWSKLINDGQARQVAVTHLRKGCNISTMFVGMQGFENDDKGNPLVFETMIFGGEHDGYCDKYGTWEDAELGHIEAIKVAMEIIDNERFRTS